MLKQIAQDLKNLGVVGPIIFTGSAALNLYKLINREISDIDIILEDNENNRRLLQSLKNLFGLKEESYSHTTLYYSKGLHLDIFLEDISKVSTLEVEDFYLATPKHILKKKLSYNREKDKKDLQEIQLNSLDSLIQIIFSL